MKTDPAYNRRRFEQFIDDIKNVCELVPETRSVFQDYPQKPPFTYDPNVNAELFILLLSRTEGYAKSLIQQQTGQGCDAITILQRHCAQITEEDKARTRKHILMLTQQRNETSTSYLRRLRQALHEAQSLDLSEFTDLTIVNQCLQGFNTHRRYEATIAQLKAELRQQTTNGHTQTMSLTSLETIFISIDENSPDSEKLFSLSDQPLKSNFHSKSHHSKPTSNNFTQKTKIVPTCYNCGRHGHTYHNCRSSGNNQSNNSRPNTSYHQKPSYNSYSNNRHNTNPRSNHNNQRSYNNNFQRKPSYQNSNYQSNYDKRSSYDHT